MSPARWGFDTRLCKHLLSASYVGRAGFVKLFYTHTWHAHTWHIEYLVHTNVFIALIFILLPPTRIFESQLSKRFISSMSHTSVGRIRRYLLTLAIADDLQIDHLHTYIYHLHIYMYHQQIYSIHIIYHLDPNLPFWHVALDLCSTDPTQETCWRLYTAPTLNMMGYSLYRSVIYLPSTM